MKFLAFIILAVLAVSCYVLITQLIARTNAIAFKEDEINGNPFDHWQYKIPYYGIIAGFFIGSYLVCRFMIG